MRDKARIYLPGLNGIRAIAAFAVVISHTNGRLDEFGLAKLPYWDLAGFGVTIFFTLSGFLITYLLLKELEKTGTVKVKKFYVRRLLRIWPLYYFYLFLILAIVGFSALGNTFFMYLAILPNIANGFITYEALPWAIPTASAMFLIGHYWSLGVEEQFYSFWPWVFKKIKNIFLFLVAFPVLFFLIKVGAKYAQLSEPIQFILHYSRFGCLAIGGLGAYIFINKKDLIKPLMKPIIQVLPWLLLGLIAFNKFHVFSIIDHEIVSIFIVVLIINQISDYRPIISLENRLSDYLGRISFGIYVYNPLSIFILYSCAQKYILLPDTILSYIIVYISVILLNVFLAHISYFYFESRFLKFKDKFAVVKSKSSAS
ncbi:acyltransferase family protein [Sphingobacterium lumbrici]|uniref:acyltransferase family protein n=1 Tax=Sphingobacterium lumbrici TaxID=2559600 RepID=UPI00112C74B1|nr:acyltransferase [Sphingobacterium lumbrici]